MLILYDFKRPDGRIVERLMPRDTTNIVCSDGVIAARVISPVRCMLEGHSGHFPDAADKWARQHEKNGGISAETKHELANQ